VVKEHFSPTEVSCEADLEIRTTVKMRPNKESEYTLLIAEVHTLGF
jgi:hypothetical protein